MVGFQFEMSPFSILVCRFFAYGFQSKDVGQFPLTGAKCLGDKPRALRLQNKWFLVELGHVDHIQSHLDHHQKCWIYWVQISSKYVQIWLSGYIPKLEIGYIYWLRIFNISGGGHSRFSIEHYGWKMPIKMSHDSHSSRKIIFTQRDLYSYQNCIQIESNFRELCEYSAL